MRIELLWGLHDDAEAGTPIRKVAETAAVLASLPPGVRGRISLSPISSGSHAKVIVYDDRATGKWTTVVGSCNFLSSDYDWVEVSLRTRSVLFATRLMCRLLTSQLPSAGRWSGTARRLNAIWSDLRRKSAGQIENGIHAIRLVTDRDHYACITHARDVARKDVEIACDLYGLAAETSVLVPMQTAAERGVEVRLRYSRPSRFLLQEGTVPTAIELAKRGMMIEQVDRVHAKYIGWDDDGLVVSSFNWMATSVEGTHAGCAEIGALVSGPGIRTMLTEKLSRLPTSGDQVPGTASPETAS